MTKYTVCYRGDDWQEHQGYLVQTVRQLIPDGRILKIDLWKGLGAVSPIILRITAEGQANEPRRLSNGVATRLSSQDIILVQAH